MHPAIPPISVFSERALIAGFAVRLAFLYPSKESTSKVARESPVPRQKKIQVLKALLEQLATIFML